MLLEGGSAMTTTMSIHDPEWSHEEIGNAWCDSEDPAVAEVAADNECAWRTTNVADRLPGWRYDEDGTFSGPVHRGSPVRHPRASDRGVRLRGRAPRRDPCRGVPRGGLSPADSTDPRDSAESPRHKIT